MSRSKIDEILNHLVDVKVKVATIEEHLRALNGKVIDHKDRICILESDNMKNKLMWAKVLGLGGASGFIGSTVAVGVIKVLSII